jgi:CRP-like cAMP-binding protein
VSIGLFRHEEQAESYRAGETIFSEGDPCTVMYGVVEGEVDTTYRGRVLETIEPGRIFGEMPRSVTATADAAD